MHVVLLGPPGVGKGTQSKILSNTSKFYHFDTGNFLRAILEKDLKNQINNGFLAPNNYIEKILNENITSLSKDIILDGIPRDIDQVYILDNFLRNIGKNISLVIELSAEYQDLKNRILNRFICLNCNEIYNLLYKSFGNICKSCNQPDKITKREDDTSEIFDKRFDIYNNKIKAIREHYEKKHIYNKIIISNNIENSFHMIDNLIKSNR